MDLSVTRLSAMNDQHETMYPSFAAPTPINMYKTYTGNTLTPGGLPSPLNFPSITPPSSPYPFYGLYSPAATQISPMYDPSYLKRLKSNPIFRDLQSVLLQDCLQMEVPANLITTSWNLMQLHKAPVSDKAPPTCTESTNENSSGSGQKVYIGHMRLQDKLLKVRIDSAISADGLSVENDYSKEVGQIEMNRYHALHSCPNETVKSTINSYYDRERLKLADITEEKLDKLMEKAERMRQAAQKVNHERIPTSSSVTNRDSTCQGALLSKGDSSSQGASLLLQPIDESDSKMNAVRKLKFNMIDDTVDEEDEENDYLNGSVNSEDFEIDEIDVETIDKEEPVNTSPEFPTSTSINNNETDLLKQCIAQSGLEAIVETDRVASNSVSSSSYFAKTGTTVSENTTRLSPYQSTIDSPVSIGSVTSTASPDLSSESNHSNHRIDNPHFFQGYSNKLVNMNNQLFSTPPSFNHSFTQPDKINMALSEIGKMCGGPSVTFTPEFRRDIAPSFTPEVSAFSPMTRTNLNMSDITTTPTFQYKPTWISPIDTVSNSGKGTGSGQKRKRPCNEEEENKYASGDQSTTNLTTDNNEVSSATDLWETDKPLNNSMFRTHRMLTADATNILSHWYSNHVQYPYPNDEEVKQLSDLTGITGRQVKKWMANKRVRCFNTLSITGNQHPIKFKYNGPGQKKRKPKVEKENCDSTTSEKRVNYSLLNDEAKMILNVWYEQHMENPYPTEEEKQELATACKISVNQVKSWFANKRNRTNNTKRQVPNYFINKYPEYSRMVQFVGQKREEARMVKRRKMNELNMYIQPNFYF